MKVWFRRKALDPLLNLLRQGVSPDELARCVALGLVIATFPSLGLPTLLAITVALVFRLNIVAIQTVNCLAHPLWFATLLPFFRAGGRLFHRPPLAISAGEMVELLRETPWLAVKQLGTATWHAVVVWGIVALPLTPALILILTPIFRRFAPAACPDEEPRPVECGPV